MGVCQANVRIEVRASYTQRGPARGG